VHEPRVRDRVQTMEEIGLIAAREALAGEDLRRDKFLLSIVVPCFNEEDVIRMTYRRLVDVLGNRGFRLQIVFVDDGSGDGTPDIVVEIAKSAPRVAVDQSSTFFTWFRMLSVALATQALGHGIADERPTWVWKHVPGLQFWGPPTDARFSDALT
jgi:cellulose synthase/poly-beta-1,6-N-acetylglucosamine synthase-like glycosyltransferase